jgi:hypothetical protein
MRPARAGRRQPFQLRQVTPPDGADLLPMPSAAPDEA